jgi:hypothetical protein
MTDKPETCQRCDKCEHPANYKCGGCNTIRCTTHMTCHYLERKANYGCAGFGAIELGSGTRFPNLVPDASECLYPKLEQLAQTLVDAGAKMRRLYCDDDSSTAFDWDMALALAATLDISPADKLKGEK